MSGVGYIAWLWRKRAVLSNYIDDAREKLHRYRNLIGGMAEGMSTYGWVEYEKMQMEHARECERMVSMDIERQSLILTATVNEIRNHMNNPAVTIGIVEEYLREHKQELDAMAIDYWDTLW
jgi:hypothetical protein